MKQYSAVTVTVLALTACTNTTRSQQPNLALDHIVAHRIVADHDLDDVLDRAKQLLTNGFNAGSGYPEVWIRDFATFMDISCQVNDHAAIRSALVTLARFQREDGNIPDGIGFHQITGDQLAPKSTAAPVLTTQITLGREIIENSAVPEYRGFKNSVETDQETSFVQSVHSYITCTHDTSFLTENIDGQTLLARMERGLDFLLNHRFSNKYGLIYGATTIDWGDIAPEDPIGAVFNEKTHPAIDVYDNAMFLIAINDFVSFVPDDVTKTRKWRSVEHDIRVNVRKHLWDARSQKFIPHLYLDSSPFPPGFDESAIWYHGGTAVAIQAGLLTHEEIAASLQSMRLNVRQARGLTVGITNYPLYPKGLFQNPNVDPGVYQNGGDWDWFGARMVEALVDNGFGPDAYIELLPIVHRVQRHDGFFEWFDMQDHPQGSSKFRGSAGVIAKAILHLKDWARSQVTATALTRSGNPVLPGWYTDLEAASVAIVVCALGAPVAHAVSGHLRAADLRCEYLRNPLGVEETSPRLSWIVESDRRAEFVSAYRIVVASSLEHLARDEGDLWDSGQVQSHLTAHIPYADSPLKSRQTCFWKVMTWDRDGLPGDWSEPAQWEMGLLSPDDWSSQWIEAGATPVNAAIERATYYSVDGHVRKDVTQRVASMLKQGEPIVASNDALGGDPAPNVPKRLAIDYRCKGALLRTDVAEHAAAVIAQSQWPYLRKTFAVTKPIERARLYATALGLYELHLNGVRVGDQHLAPGWTDYRKRVQYQVYDVTDQIKRGDNMLGAIVGPGWFSGRAGLFHAREFYGKTPAILTQLEITYLDGSIDRVISDQTWRRHDGPILAADLMDGEIHDANAEIEGWCAAGVEENDWTPVTVRNESRTLESAIDQPVRVIRQMPSLSVNQPKPGQWTFDLGQNMVGVVRLRVRAKPGTVVTIRHGEMLNPDGTIYAANLRGAAATDVYICKGRDVEEWQPQFTYHGFRYVEVTGLTEKPGLAAVTGIVLGSDLPAAGEFSCSDERINQLQSNIVWGLRGNYVSIPTDCPQRDERMGWMADTQVFAPTAAFNAGVAAFMTKWMLDVDDAQRADGAYSDVAPAMNGLSYGTPAWADAGTIVPWTIFQMYGDSRILERHIDSMMRWVEWCKRNSTDLIRDRARGNDYGDWLSINADTPKDLIGTAYFAHSTDIVAKSLRILGRDAEADRYRQLFEDIRAAFNARYVDNDGRVAAETQCGYVLALRFDLLPNELRDKAISRLVADVQAKDWHLSTGFVGVGNLLPVLSEAGRADVAYRLLMQDTFPSWLFAVKHGATTIWERWNGWTPERGVHPDASMNSFNHYALGSCGQWLFAGVGGIEPDPEHPGFEHFFVRPRIDSQLHRASATYRSIRGTISTQWNVDGDLLTLNVTIPANTSATVFVPLGERGDALESGRMLEATEGVQLLRRDNDAVVLRVGSGSYEFTSRTPVAHSGNPVLAGWYADPEAACFENQFWIYPTYSAPYDEQVLFDAFSSPDLVHWTKHSRVLEASATSWAKRAMWAPSVVEKGGKYFFFFSANDIQNDDQVGGIGVAVGDSPAGPFTDYLGKPLVDAFHNGAQPIDQFVFRDKDDRFYLIYGGWGHCDIALLKDDFRGFETLSNGSTFTEITPEQYVEGPFMFERGGKYYFMWSEGGWNGPDYSVAYGIADSPRGPFQRIGKILQQDPNVATGAGHHSVLRIPDTDEYYIVYHRRPLGDTDRNHRVVCIDRMKFDADGRIEPVKITFEGVMQHGRR